MGGVFYAVSGQVFAPISILAPAWGASGYERREYQQQRISILAPAWGASTKYQSEHAHDNISILAPAWGASAYLYKCKPLFMCITEEINTISDFL